MKIIAKKQANGKWIAEVVEVPSKWSEGTSEEDAISKLVFVLVQTYNVQVEVSFLP